MTTAISAPPPVLYAEDDEDDAFFMQRAFITADILNPLHIVYDGQGAIDYLAGSGRYTNRIAHPLPCLLLLDLYLPRRSGLEVLAWTRAREEYQDLSIVVLTCSDDPYYTQEAYDLGANAYLIKPPNAKKVEEMARNIDRFWLRNKKSSAPCLEFKGQPSAAESSILLG